MLIPAYCTLESSGGGGCVSDFEIATSVYVVPFCLDINGGVMISLSCLKCELFALGRGLASASG